MKAVLKRVSSYCCKMLVFARVRKRVKSMWNDLTRKQFLWTLFGLVFVLLLFTKFSPMHFFKMFFQALVRIARDFDFGTSRDINDCSMILWTRKNPSTEQIIIESSIEELSKTNFNSSHPTKILIHGFSDAPSTSWTRSVRDAYLKKGDHNIFSVDWGKLCRPPWYTTAVKNARHVGRYTANFIDILVSPPFNSTWSSMHVIGASLGAQVAGHVGHAARGRLPRITGLDPCGPLFHTTAPEFRLDRSDADFVDVIHSAGKWVGNDDKIGHADFFPNLGRAPQPGCDGRESIDLYCSHFMSWQMFSDSINSETPFFAIKCASEKAFVSGRCCLDPDLSLESVVVMGDAVNTSIRGQFWLYTDGRTPKKTKEESVDCKWVV